MKVGIALMVNVLKDNLDVLKDMTKMISAEIGCNLIICDHEGEIIEATQVERIGRSHVGSKIIMSGLTDEAVISRAQEEAFQKLGTDTRVGYNYVIIIQGKRVGSLGMGGEPESIKPIVRMAAKTIGIYVSEYLNEKEKNKVIQKMSRIAEEITDKSKDGLDYQVFTDDLLLISGARYVLFNIYSTYKDICSTVSISGGYEDIRKADEEILGYSILGKQRNISNSVYNELTKARMVTFANLSELPSEIISYDKAVELMRVFGLGQVSFAGITHKDNVIGEFVFILNKGQTLKNEVLLELYSAQVGHLLKRVEAEAALKKSESKYRILVEKLNDVIFNLDKQGCIRYISPAIQVLLDYTPEEMIGKSFDSYIYPNDLDIVQKVFESNMMGNDESVVIRIIDKSDKVYHVRISTNLIQEDEEAMVLGVMTDVTEQQQALNILDSFWEHSPNPISIFDKKGKIIRISKSSAAIFGTSPELLEGREIPDVFPFSVAQEMMGRLQAICDSKESQSYTDSIFFNDEANGYYESWLFPISNEEDTDLVGMVALDITDRKQTEERLNYLSFHDPITGLHNRTYYERELKRLDNGNDYPISVISLDADGLKIVNDTMGHSMGDEFLKNLGQTLKRSLRDSDILARVGGDEFIVFLPDTDKPTAERIVERIRKNIILHNQENQTLPLRVSLGLETAESRADSLEEILKRADEIMYNNKFFQKKNSQSQILDSFMASLEKRDYVSQGYAERLFRLFAKVSQSSRLPSGTLKALALLAQVHDLGYATIPESILSKPAPLNDEEWKVIRLHPEKGSRIASVFPNLVDIAELIMKHHERWDGRGYPLGLKGKEIPIECRILAVVDSFDAMIKEKPYRKAFSKLEAIKELQRCSGTQFDPEIVDFFIETLIEEGLDPDIKQMELFA